MCACSVVSDSFATPWTIARQVSLCMGFSKQEYWRGLPFPSPGDLPNPGIKPRSSTLQVDSLPSEPPGKPKNTGVGSLSLLQGIFWPRNLTGVSCLAGRFFTSWALSPYEIIKFCRAGTFPCSPSLCRLLMLLWKGCQKMCPTQPPRVLPAVPRGGWWGRGGDK